MIDNNSPLPKKPRRDREGRALPECRMDTCKRGHEAPHEFRFLQPGTWSMTCTECRRERRELEAGE